MEDIFAQASLCYLTNRCEEGFQFIYRALINSSNKFSLDEEERRVFCFTSINILEKRSRSWINLQRLLAKTDPFNERQSIESYLQIVLDEINTYAEQILHLINHCLSISSEAQIFYWKLQGDIHFLLSQSSVFDQKLQHFLSSLHFYNQSLESPSHNATQRLSIIYNKALLFTVITEEYDRARDLLRGAIDDFDRKRLPSARLRSLLKYLETKL